MFKGLAAVMYSPQSPGIMQAFGFRGVLRNGGWDFTSSDDMMHAVTPNVIAIESYKPTYATTYGQVKVADIIQQTVGQLNFENNSNVTIHQAANGLFEALNERVVKDIDLDTELAQLSDRLERESPTFPLRLRQTLKKLILKSDRITMMLEDEAGRLSYQDVHVCSPEVLLAGFDVSHNTATPTVYNISPGNGALHISIDPQAEVFFHISSEFNQKAVADYVTRGLRVLPDVVTLDEASAAVARSISALARDAFKLSDDAKVPVRGATITAE